jgi:gliding motility-associated-like protein
MRSFLRYAGSIKTVLFLFCLFVKNAAVAQLPTCPSQLLYGLIGTTIYAYDPSQPISAGNPASTGVTGAGSGLTVMPNINGGAGPTFYTIGAGMTIQWWNGSSWVNTTNTVQAVNLGGCGTTLYCIQPPNLYVYNGNGNATLLMTVPASVVYDVIPDCDCNFWLLGLGMSPTLTKYSPNGTVLATYTVTGYNGGSGAGFWIVGNTIYHPGIGGVYAGNIGVPNSVITCTLHDAGNLALTNDFANCPITGVGSVTASIAGGTLACAGNTLNMVVTTTTSPVSYTWSGPGIVGAINGSVATASVAGIYTCAVTALGGCGAAVTLTTQVFNNYCISVVSNSITCANLGSATVTAVNGIGPFSYTWMPSGQTGPVATGLSPGIYTVSVFDQGKNYTYTATTVFNSLIPLTATVVNSSSITCNGVGTGSAQATNITGGSGTQNYLWTNGVMTSTLANPANLTGGIWTYTITDALTGCTVSNAFIINQPPALALNLSSNTPSVCAGGSVALTGTVSGGTPKNPAPAYGYTWTSGPNTTSYAPVQNISGNYIYTLTASDFYNCKISNTIAVNVIPNPTLVALSASICPLQTATLAVTGAVNYSWNAVPGPYTLAVNPLVNTSYTITGESQGCFASTTASVTIKSLPPITLIIPSLLCQGEALTFSVSVGGGGLAFNWAGPLGYTAASQSHTISPVQLNHAGVYNLTVTAANGCTVAGSRIVNVMPSPTLVVSPASPSICLNTTSVVLSALTNANQFSWNNAAGGISVNTQTIAVNPSATTVYSVMVSDAFTTCWTTGTATVHVLPPPSLTVSLSSSSLCAQALNGSPASIVLSSSGAFTYTLITPLHISNVNPSGPNSPLGVLPPYQPAGPTTATLLGSNGVCTVSTTALFTIVPNPTVSISSATPMICAGESFTYTSAGADSYAWSSATPGQTLYTTGSVAVANPSINSVFSVMGGSLGCNSALQSSTLTVNPLPSFSVQPANICIGSSVRLAIVGTGAAFAWSPGFGLSAISGASVLASPSSSQNYTVLSSLNSCTSSAVVTVSVMPIPVAVIAAPSSSVCLNSSIMMSGSGGLGYSWAGPQGFFTTGPNLDLKAGSTAYSGTYTLTVMDQNGCQGIATQPITVLDLPAGQFSVQDLKDCAPFRARFNFSMSPALAPAASMSWRVNGQTFTGNNFNYLVPEPGNYPVLGTVTDVNGCANTFTAMIEGYSKPQADFYFSPDKPVEGLDAVSFTDGSAGAVKFDWFFGSNDQHSQQKNPRFVFEHPGTYPVALVVSNTWGCSDTIVKPVVVEYDFSVYVPNAFTPDGDGLNDLFGPVMRGVQSYHFVIMNRWGETLFETSSFDASWDGFYKGKPCKEEVYVWTLEAKSKSSPDGLLEKKLTGEVLLYR